MRAFTDNTLAIANAWLDPEVQDHSIVLISFCIL